MKIKRKKGLFLIKVKKMILIEVVFGHKILMRRRKVMTMELNKMRKKTDLRIRLQEKKEERKYLLQRLK